MPITLLIHIAAGGLAIVAGYVALAAAKGNALHRRGGTWFVGSMVVMGTTGAAIAAARGIEGSIVGGVLAAYLAVTALTAVRPPTPWTRRLEMGGMLVAVAAGAASVRLGMDALARGGTLDGIPAPPMFLFGAVGLLSALGDLRMMRAGGTRGTPRLVRHLWRMCFALWIATGSFFLGQADEFPEPLRIFPLLAVPAFLPLLAMVWWLWRVRVRRTLRGISPLRASAPDPRLGLQAAKSI